MIGIALKADVLRFESVSDAKKLIKDLQTTAGIATPSVTRSASQPLSRSYKNSTLVSSKQSPQKSQPAKNIPSRKVASPTTAESPPQQPRNPPKPPKLVKEDTTPKIVCTKAKKKIHKISEGKRDPLKRVPERALVETADISKLRLTEKDKRKIRRLLLLRQVREWPQVGEHRREGR